MIYWKREGEKVRNGLSVYHPKDESSVGVCIRFGRHLLGVRYSKNTKKWTFRYDKITTDDWNEYRRFKRK